MRSFDNRGLAILVAPMLFVAGWLLIESVNAAGIDVDLDHALATGQMNNVRSSFDYRWYFRDGFETEVRDFLHLSRWPGEELDSLRRQAYVEGQLACRHQLIELQATFGESRLRRALRWKHAYCREILEFHKRAILTVIGSVAAALGVLSLIALLNRSADPPPGTEPRHEATLSDLQMHDDEVPLPMQQRREHC